MANFSIKNLDVAQAKEVRIYRVSETGQLTPAVGMTVLDDGGDSIGTRLKNRVIEPITNASGILEINDDFTFENLEISDGVMEPTLASNANQVKSKLESLGFEVLDLPVWSNGV